MIPRLNTCPSCNDQAPALSPLRADAIAMHRAMHDLLFLVCEGWRIDRLAAWLARRLP